VMLAQSQREYLDDEMVITSLKIEHVSNTSSKKSKYVGHLRYHIESTNIRLMQPHRSMGRGNHGTYIRTSHSSNIKALK